MERCFCRKEDGGFGAQMLVWMGLKPIPAVMSCQAHGISAPACSSYGHRLGHPEQSQMSSITAVPGRHVVVFPPHVGSDCASFYPKVRDAPCATLVLSRETSISGEVIYGK